jgi:hydrogenase-4 component B
MTAQLFGAFFILCAIGAVGALLALERWSSIFLAAIGSLSAISILLASALLLVGDTSFRAELWPVLSLGTMELAADRLSALFLFIAGLVLLPVSIFSGIYLEKYRKHYSLQYFGVLYHALIASIVLILIANDVISFLLSWESMSIASYLLVNFEYERDESSHAGFVMLAMSEAGTIAVILAFILAAGASGGFAFDQLRSAGPLSEGIGWAVFLL